MATKTNVTNVGGTREAVGEMSAFMKIFQMDVGKFGKVELVTKQGIFLNPNQVNSVPKGKQILTTVSSRHKFLA